MCIMSLTVPNHPLPSVATMTQCWDRNPDGAGFAYAAAGKLQVRKGFMSPEALHEALTRAFPSGTYDAPVAIHWRIGTHGAKSPENTHPWWVVENKVALLHNGIIRNLDPARVTGAIPTASDSQWFAALLQPFILGALSMSPASSIFTRTDGKPTRFARSLRLLAGEFIEGGYPNKVILLDQFGGSLVLGAEKGDVDADNGTWWSNTGWRSYSTGLVCDPRAGGSTTLPATTSFDRFTPKRRRYIGTREVITEADAKVTQGRPRVRVGDSDDWHEPRYSLDEVKRSFDA